MKINEYTSTTDPLPARLFTLLKDLSYLQDLYINFSPAVMDPHFIMGECPQVMDPILPLALESVTLDWVYLPAAIPNGLKLETPWRKVSYLLPNLRHLVLHLGLSTPFPDESDNSDDGDLDKPVGLVLQTLEGSAESRLFGKRGEEDQNARRDTNELARRLLSIWPNLRRVMWPAARVSVPELEGIALLNLQIGEPWRISSSDNEGTL
ncbi:hypothetical protein FRC06_008181 [Ceratobasidium sp. 370]|nr:hypothetical protein FRC06_008181 [Ceratobasidium sp. 370]